MHTTYNTTVFLSTRLKSTKLEIIIPFVLGWAMDTRKWDEEKLRLIKWACSYKLGGGYVDDIDSIMISEIKMEIEHWWQCLLNKE